MKIVVTGASGTIGSPAVDLLLGAGHQVTALVRPGGDARRWEGTGVRSVPADLFDPAAVRRAFAGQDAVVNLATRIPRTADAVRRRAWREDDRIRTEGSRVVAEAAVAAGVGRLVQEAVTFVYPASGNEWITERTPPAPNPRSQAATMAAAASAARFAVAGGTAVVLRFGQLYGPDRNSHDVLARARAGKPVLLGEPAGWLAPLHPDDAARAVVDALACPGGIFNVCEPPVRRGDWARAVGSAAGAGRPARFYPALVQRLAGPRAEPLARSHRVSSVAFQEVAGWRPRCDSLDGGWSARSAHGMA